MSSRFYLTLTYFLQMNRSTLETAMLVVGKMTIGFSILLMVAVNICQAQPKCRTTEMCELENTRGVSTNSSLVRRSSIYPASCPRACSQRPDCIATTYDPATETCDLHVVDADGALCINVSTSVGSTLALTKWFGIPCPKVRHNG